MTFLNPAVLFGLFAASLPVLIHLFNLRKVRTVEFSTLQFLKELQRQKIRKIKIKQWILLALRVLGIILLVMAFARPTLQGTTLAGAGSAAKTTAVILFDDSFSMEALSSTGSAFNRAKSFASEIISNLNEGDQSVLIPFSLRKDETPFSTVSPAEMQKRITALTPSVISGTLHEAVLRAAGILASSDNFNKEVYILSDLQKSRLADGEVVTDLSNGLNNRVKVYVLPLAEKQPLNISVDSLLLRSRILQKNKTIYLSSFVTNHSSSQSTAVVSLFINGERVAQNSITLAPGATGEAGLESVLKSSGPQEIYASVEDDDLQEDNKRFLGFLVPDQLKIGMFSDDPSELTLADLALKAGDFNGTLKIDKRVSAQINSVNLNDYNVLFLCGSAINTERINTYIEQGGGVFLFPSAKSTVASFNPVISSLGLGAVTENRAGLKDGLQTEKPDFAHPLFYGLFHSGNKSELESPLVSSYLRIDPAGAGRPIIQLQDKSPFLTEYKKGRGKVLLLSVPPTQYSGNLPFKSLFALMLYRGALYLSTGEDKENTVTAGQPILLPVPPGKQITVTLPDKKDEIVPAGDKKQITFSETRQNGIYRYSAGGSIFALAAVNTNPAESEFGTLSFTDVKDYFSSVRLKGSINELSGKGSLTAGIKEARYGAELWRYFLLFALLVFIAEMLIGRNTKKEFQALTTP